MPIDGISELRRMPLLGTIRLGIKKESARKDAEGRPITYPEATDYFVCPDEVKALYGEQPTRLKIMFPSDNLDIVAPQWLKCYSYHLGLLCKGTGTTCVRKIDAETGEAFATKESTRTELVQLDCDPEHCEMIGRKQCRRHMRLVFMLPDVPRLGVYQLNTSSFNSIVNINSYIGERQIDTTDPDKPKITPPGFLRQITKGRISFIPLILSLIEQDVTPLGIGRKKVHVLTLDAEVKMSDLIAASTTSPQRVLLPTFSDEEPPDDLYPTAAIGGPDAPGAPPDDSAAASPAAPTAPSPPPSTAVPPSVSSTPFPVSNPPSTPPPAPGVTMTDEDLERALMETPPVGTPAWYRQQIINSISTLSGKKQKNGADIARIIRGADPDLAQLAPNIKLKDVRDEYLKAIADALQKAVNSTPDASRQEVP
jgi:hypothetical protein